MTAPKTKPGDITNAIRAHLNIFSMNLLLISATSELCGRSPPSKYLTTWAADKKAKTESDSRETVAKPMTDKERKKRDAKLRKELETPYKKWLNEDVGYIISDEERKAFSRLSTDEERQSFIEQFWLRRDP